MFFLIVNIYNIYLDIHLILGFISWSIFSNHYIVLLKCFWLSSTIFNRVFRTALRQALQILIIEK